MKKKHNQEELINQNIKIEELETSNRTLLEKLKLLKIQLESQSQLQASAFHLYKSAPTHRSQTNLCSRNYSANGSLRHDENSKNTLGKQCGSLFQQLNILQEELENVKKFHTDRISELEEQLKKNDPISPSKLKTELNENVELIKLKRLTKKQIAQIQSLQSQLEVANSEIKQLQSSVTALNDKNENLQSELSQEKGEIAKLLSNIETLKDTNKFLEEQLNDLQKEKNTLKEHNENLLKLSLQKESNTNQSDLKISFLKQIKELEDNLKKEVMAKSDALTKLADSEILNVKLQNELAKNNAMITELKISNSTLKEQTEALKDKLDYINLKINQNNYRSTADKAIMTIAPENVQVNYSKNVLENLSNVTEAYNANDANFKIQLYKTSNELNQCKELLRVQYGLNNKYKSEIEELQKIFQKKEKNFTDYLRILQNVFRKHEERFLQIKPPANIKENLIPILKELNSSGKLKKVNYHDYLNSADKLFNFYISVLENFNTKDDSNLKKDVYVHVTVSSKDKSIQTETFTRNYEETITDKITNVTLHHNKKLPHGTAFFELQFGSASFTYFSEHLIRSTENNPKIFLTWNFMDDNEHQAYTPTISVNDGQFNCSCQYEGPWSKVLYDYLYKYGINVEIHLVQHDISVRLAESKIETSSSIQKCNEYHSFILKFENDNIKGSITGSYMLSYDIDITSFVEDV